MIIKYYDTYISSVHGKQPFCWKHLPGILLKCAEIVILIIMAIIGANLVARTLYAAVIFIGILFEIILKIFSLMPISLLLYCTYGINPIYLGITITVGSMIGLLTPHIWHVHVRTWIVHSGAAGNRRALRRALAGPLILTWLNVALREPLVMLAPNATSLGQGL